MLETEFLKVKWAQGSFLIFAFTFCQRCDKSINNDHDVVKQLADFVLWA